MTPEERMKNLREACNACAWCALELYGVSGLKYKDGQHYYGVPPTDGKPWPYSCPTIRDEYEREKAKS